MDFGSDGSQFMIFGARDWRQKASFFQFVNITSTVNWVGAELMIAMLAEAACQVRITSCNENENKLSMASSAF